MTIGDKNGWTPLFFAARNGDERLLDLLITDNTIDLNVKDNYNSTPLSLAVRNGHEGTVNFFLTTDRVSLDSTDNFGRNLIWWCRRSGYSDIEKLMDEKAQKKGYIFPKVDFPNEKALRSYKASSRWCDICMLHISKDGDQYKCEVCNGGGGFSYLFGVL